MSTLLETIAEVLAFVEREGILPTTQPLIVREKPNGHGLWIVDYYGVKKEDGDRYPMEVHVRCVQGEMPAVFNVARSL
jgi:hypothetical protein